MVILLTRGRTVIGISGSLIWSKILMELIFNPCGEFQWSPDDPVSQIHSPHLHVGAPGIFSDLLRYVQMLKREWGVESKGKLPQLFIPCKTTLAPEFAVEDLPLDRTEICSCICIERPALGQNILMNMIINEIDWQMEIAPTCNIGTFTAYF